MLTRSLIPAISQRPLSLREAMDRLFEDSVLWPTHRYSNAARALPVNVREYADRYVVTASVPGVTQSDLDITGTRDALTVKVTRTAPADEEGTWIIQEHAPIEGEATRTVAFDQPIDADAVTAELTAGVLTVTAPKAAEVRPKQVKIQLNG